MYCRRLLCCVPQLEMPVEYTRVKGDSLLNMSLFEELLSERGFPPPEAAEGRSSVADLYKPGARCGVYVLMFTDGQAYVGQSVDVVRRYAQHCYVHQDIKALTFKEVCTDDLDREEQELIRVIEQTGYGLRNTVFSALPPIESDFDLVMDPSEQRLWLTDLDKYDTTGPRIINDGLRRKQAAKYKRFRENCGIDEIIENVRQYVRSGIPAIKRSEVSFWSLSCLPAYACSEITVFMRLNIHWQEVLTVFREKQSGLDFFSLHVAAEPVEADVQLRDDVPEVEIYEHRYVPGGHDQVNLVVPCRALNMLMSRRSLRTAIRRFNHRLMKKGACNFARHHCLDLADTVLED